MIHRPRRLRSNESIRELIAETRVSVSSLMQPYFLSKDRNAVEPITNFTGVHRYGIDKLLKEIETDLECGVKSFLLFGGAENDKKDEVGSDATHLQSIVPQAIRDIKKQFGKDLTLFSDVCLCPYTSHGHCGVIREDQVDNDSSLDILAEMARVHAEAGVDFVAPSDMMDGRVGRIREVLDSSAFQDVGILAYTAKYASSYYGPFREALGSSPKGEVKLKGRDSYQMDFRNSRDALLELELDLTEGADMVMVKPALAYLDIIQLFKQNSTKPVVAYSVSAEYEMVKQLAKSGLVDENKMALENLTAIKRAGADIVITYFASPGARNGWFL